MKAAFALRARGGSWRETANVLIEAGVPTWHGRTVWTPQSTQNLIKNRAYRAPDGRFEREGPNSTANNRSTRQP